jgi:hypothetical protein
MKGTNRIPRMAPACFQYESGLYGIVVSAEGASSYLNYGTRSPAPTEFAAFSRGYASGFRLSQIPSSTSRYSKVHP